MSSIHSMQDVNQSSLKGSSSTPLYHIPTVYLLRQLGGRPAEPTAGQSNAIPNLTPYSSMYLSAQRGIGESRESPSLRPMVAFAAVYPAPSLFLSSCLISFSFRTFAMVVTGSPLHTFFLSWSDMLQATIISRLLLLYGLHSR